MDDCQRVKLSEIIFQDMNAEKIEDTEKERYITLALYGKGARERIIKDGKYPVPFLGYRVSTGQFIYSRIDARNGAYGIIGEELNGCVVSKDFPVYDIDTERILPQFLLRAVLSNSFIEQVKSSSFGATNRMRIKEDIFENYSIKLPVLEEQRKIVKNLDAVQQVIISRKRELEFLEELVRARFVEMFGAPGKDVFGWGLTSLGSVCNINPKKSQDNRLNDNLVVSFIPMTAITENGKINVSLTKKYNEVKTGFTYFAENDVLFAKITPCMENGKGAIARGLYNGIGFGSTELHVIRPAKGRANPYWVYTLTSFPQFRVSAANNMTGSAGQRRVPSSFLENYNVSVPPIKRQEQFASFVQIVDKSKVVVQKALDEAQLLFDSLMQKYFG